jgi:ribosome-associated toxin RatA of RatAB toxin-antitoxin module
MPTVERSLVIQAERDALFDLTQDYGRRLLWDPFLREARLLDGATHVGAGARAWCVAWHGLGMETEYVSFSPPAVVAVKMTRGPTVLAAFAASWRFAEERPGATRVTFRYHYKARPRLFRRLIEAVLGVVFLRDARLRLHALQQAAEVGRLLDARM